MRLYKTILIIHNQVFMCIHIDSRFPICSDYCKTLINLHGKFWSSDQTIENGGTKQQQQQQKFWMVGATIQMNKEET